MDAIIACQSQVRELLHDRMRNGFNARITTHAISTIADTISTRVMQFALRELGAPPTRFAFMVLGSHGRGEQSLKTDQDNAILYADGPSDGKRVHDYFLRLSRMACGLLNQAGYAYCQGKVMANNPRWCQPLSVWRQYFSNWIHTAESEDLLQANIFFDFKGAVGDMALVDTLRRHLFRRLDGWPGFFRHLAENALYFKPCPGAFRKIRRASTNGKGNTLDIKRVIMPIVDFTRVYALKYRIHETNTWRRLHLLGLKNALSPKESDELEKAYSLLMQLRLEQQIRTLMAGETGPSNHIDPKSLTKLEKAMLKEIFRQIRKFQDKMAFDFIGDVSAI